MTKSNDTLVTLMVLGAGVGAWLWYDSSRVKTGAGGETSAVTNKVASTVRALLPSTTANGKVASTASTAVKAVNPGVVGAPASVLTFDGVRLPASTLAVVNEVEGRAHWLEDPGGYLAPELPTTFAEAVERAIETGSTNGTYVPGMTQDEMLAVFRASLGIDQ
ncbi:MAG: hypothetical protein EPO65_06760 [Dehalococcoidia bacterium]|nr:MAG: hypothetical protein EPO65_06760 [Dehalococcoidia bacterium]